MSWLKTLISLKIFLLLGWSSWSWLCNCETKTPILFFFYSPLTSWPIVLILHAIKYSVNPSHDGYRSSFWVKEVCSGMKILKNYHFWIGCMIWNQRSIRRSRQLAGMHLDIDRTSLCGLEPVICEHKRSINRCTDHRSWILASATKWFPLMAEKWRRSVCGVLHFYIVFKEYMWSYWIL